MGIVVFLQCGNGKIPHVVIHNLLRSRRVVFDYTSEALLNYVNSLSASFESVMVVPDLGSYQVFKENYSNKGTERYNYRDEFQFNPEREAVYNPDFSLWVDKDNPGLLHLLCHFNATINTGA